MTERPNWWPKLKRAAEANGLPLEEAVSFATILHEDDCARVQGTGVCDCDPDVHMRSRRLTTGQGEV